MDHLPNKLIVARIERVAAPDALDEATGPVGDRQAAAMNGAMPLEPPGGGKAPGRSLTVRPNLKEP